MSCNWGPVATSKRAGPLTLPCAAPRRPSQVPVVHAQNKPYSTASQLVSRHTLPVRIAVICCLLWVPPPDLSLGRLTDSPPHALRCHSLLICPSRGAWHTCQLSYLHTRNRSHVAHRPTQRSRTPSDSPAARHCDQCPFCTISLVVQ